MARSQTGKGHDQYPLFQLWRPNGTGRYERVHESSSDSEEMFRTVADKSGLTVAEYVPKNPVPFQADDILGVYQPGGVTDRRLSLWFASVPTTVITTILVMSLEVFNTDES